MVGVVHRAESERADQRGDALTAGDPACRKRERAEHGRQSLLGACRRADRDAVRRRSRCSTTLTGSTRTTVATSSTCASPKCFVSGRAGADIGVDLQNLLNTNYATAYETQYLVHRAERRDLVQPDAILGPRFMRFNFTLNY